MLESFPCNHLTLQCQDPISQRAYYYVRHAKISANPRVLFRLLLVPILAKVIVTKIGPFTYVNSIMIYAFYPCGTNFERGARVNISSPYLSETPTVLGYSLENRPPFPLTFDYSNHILSVVLPGWARLLIYPFNPEFTDSTLESAMRYRLLVLSIKVQIIWDAYLHW